MENVRMVKMFKLVRFQIERNQELFDIRWVCLNLGALYLCMDQPKTDLFLLKFVRCKKKLTKSDSINHRCFVWRTAVHLYTRDVIRMVLTIIVRFVQLWTTMARYVCMIYWFSWSAKSTAEKDARTCLCTWVSFGRVAQWAPIGQSSMLFRFNVIWFAFKYYRRSSSRNTKIPQGKWKYRMIQWRIISFLCKECTRIYPFLNGKVLWSTLTI